MILAYDTERLRVALKATEEAAVAVRSQDNIPALLMTRLTRLEGVKRDIIEVLDKTQKEEP